MMANNRSVLTETAYYPAKRVVKANAGPYGSLQLPVTIANEEYKAVIDVGLPTSLVSTGLWQKFNSALYPTTDNDITQRVMRRTNLQLMGYTHFQLQVKDTLLELEEVLVYDFDEPEIFLNISAVAALGLVIDFQEGTFGLRQQEGFKVCWTEDTLLYPDDRLGNTSLQTSNDPSLAATNAPDFVGNEYMNPIVAIGSYGSPPYGGPDGNIHAMGPMGMGPMHMGPPPFSPMIMGPRPMGPPLGLQNYPNSLREKLRRKKLNNGKMNFFMKKRESPVVINVPITMENTLPTTEHNNSIVNNDKNMQPRTSHGSTPTQSKNSQSSSKNNPPKVTKTNLTNIKNMFNNMKNKPKDKYNSPGDHSHKDHSDKHSHKDSRNFDAYKYSTSSNRNSGNPNASNSAKRRSSPSRFGNDSDNSGKKSKLQCVNCGANNHLISNCHKPIVLKCQACGRAGHTRNDCPTLVRASAISKSNPTPTTDGQKTKTQVETSTVISSSSSTLPRTSTVVSSSSSTLPTSVGGIKPVLDVKNCNNVSTSASQNSTGNSLPISSSGSQDTSGKKMPTSTSNNSTPNLVAGKKMVRKVIVKKILVKKGSTVPVEGIAPSGTKIIRRVIKQQPGQPSPTGTTRTILKKIVPASTPKQDIATKPIANLSPIPKPVPDLEDVFKKPEADLLIRKPVRRVVAKKTIKLNMLSPPKAKDSDASPNSPVASPDSSAK